MPYSTDIAQLLTDQLTKFVTLNRHQLAGQVANLDFWLDEVRHALAVLDGYGQRFHSLKQAQTRHVAEHHTLEFEFEDPCCSRGSPAPPVRTPDAEIEAARRALREATYRFLLRCLKAGMIEPPALRTACESLGIGVDPADLRVRA